MFRSFSSKFLLAAGLVLLLPATAAWAQAPGSGGPEPEEPPVTSVPLDGGASLLLAGGVAYGLKRLRKRKA